MVPAQSLPWERALMQSDINLPPCQDRFIEEAAKLGKPLVGVHFDGRPISSDVADEKLNAILEAWNPSEAGARAIVSVLTGEENQAEDFRYVSLIMPVRFQSSIIT